MTAWYIAANGEELYGVSLPHRELRLVWQALDARVRAIEARIFAEDDPIGGAAAVALATDYLTLQYLRDRFDPAKVRSDWLRTHDGPVPKPPEPP